MSRDNTTHLVSHQDKSTEDIQRESGRLIICSHWMKHGYQRWWRRLLIHALAQRKAINGLKVKWPRHCISGEVCRSIPHRDCIKHDISTRICNEQTYSLSASGPTTCLLVPPWSSLLIAAGRRLFTTVPSFWRCGFGCALEPFTNFLNLAVAGVEGALPVLRS